MLEEFDKHMENLAAAEDKLEKLHRHFGTGSAHGIVEHTNGQAKKQAV